MPPVFFCATPEVVAYLRHAPRRGKCVVWVSSASPKRVGCVVRLSPMRPPLTRRADGVMME